MNPSQFAKRLINCIFILVFPALVWCSKAHLLVEVTGLDKEDNTAVLSNLSLKNIEDEKELNLEQMVNLYELGRDEITTSLESLGFYHAKITSDFKTSKQGFLAEYHITPGPAVIIKRVNLKITGDGKDNKDLLALIEQLSLKAGKRLKHKTYENLKQSLLAKSLQQGYLDAIYSTNEVQVDLEKNEANIYLHLETGFRYTFGDINFLAPPYPIDYLKRYVPFSQGTPYTTEKLLSFQKTMIESDLFSKVRIDPDLNATQGLAVPLNVRLIPKPRNKYTASIGFSTDYGPRGSLGWEHRRSSHPGHRINMNIKSSKRLNQANAQYIIPGKHPATDRLAFGTRMIEEKPSDKKYSLRSETSLTRLQKRGKFEQILGIQSLTEIYRELPTDPKKRSHLLLPSAGFTWSNIEKKSLLQHGIRVIGNVKGGLKSLLSSTNLAKGELGIKWIIPAGDLTRFILRTDVGAIKVSDIHTVPLSLRFFTGGDHTVRGYGFNSIGPREKDKNGDIIVTGGRYLFVASGEIEQKIYKKFGAAIFIDTGNAMNTWKSRLSTGAGAGFRYETPLGALRLDVARPLLKGKHRPRIHFTFGMDL